MNLKQRIWYEGHSSVKQVVEFSHLQNKDSWDADIVLRFPFDIENFLRKRFVPYKLILMIIGWYIVIFRENRLVNWFFSS
jgi:hypothetical protein